MRQLFDNNSELLPLVEKGASWEVFAFANIFTKLNGQFLPWLQILYYIIDIISRYILQFISHL